MTKVFKNPEEFRAKKRLYYTPEYYQIHRIRFRLNSYRSHDKRGGRPRPDLTLADLIRIFAMPCEYCGLAGDDVGCDRIDNSLPHNLANVCPCCDICNTARNDHISVWEMKTFIGPAIRVMKLARISAEHSSLQVDQTNRKVL